MRTKSTFVSFLLAIALVAIGWDLYTLASPENGDSLLEIMLDYARESVALPLIAGICIGHLMWPQIIERVDYEEDENGE